MVLAATKTGVPMQPAAEHHFTGKCRHPGQIREHRLRHVLRQVRIAIDQAQCVE